MGPEIIRVELIDGKTIDPNRARGSRPDAQQNPNQARFPGSARTNDRERFALFKLERDPAEHSRPTSWRNGNNLLDLELALRWWQRHSLLTLHIGSKKILEARPSATRILKILPLANCQLDRGKRTTNNDRGRNNSTSGQLTLDTKITAKAENKQLHDLAKCLHPCHERTAAVTCHRLPSNLIIAPFAPAPPESRRHTHGTHDFSVA